MYVYGRTFALSCFLSFMSLGPFVYTFCAVFQFLSSITKHTYILFSSIVSFLGKKKHLVKCICLQLLVISRK